jgi:hypothetical protein
MLFIESISYLSVLGAAVVGFGVALMILFGLAFLYHYLGASLGNAFVALEFIMLFAAVSLGMLIWER